MTLIKCPDCGKEMSSEAPACPGCGRPNPAVEKKRSTSTRDAGCLLMLLAFFASFVVPPGLYGMTWILLLVGLVIAVLGLVKK